MRYIVIAAAALLLAGCDLLTGQSRPNVQFAFEPVDEPIDFDINTFGALWVNGSIPTPCMPYTVRRDVRVSGSTVDLSIIGQQPATCNPENPGFIEYVAGIGVGPGTYNLRIYHDWPGTPDWPRVLALDTTITIQTF
jgi:hypothetical protein